MSTEILGKAFDFAVGEIISQAVSRVMAARTAALRRAVIDEFARGNLDLARLAKQDEFIAAMIALIEGLRRGVAIENLRIIARIMVSKFNTPNSGSDDLFMWAEMISTLTEEEKYFLAILAKCDRRASERHSLGSFEHEDAVDKDFAREILDQNPFCSDHEGVQVAGFSLLRSGCVKPIPLSGGGFRFAGTPKLRRLAQMADLEPLADELAGKKQ